MVDEAALVPSTAKCNDETGASLNKLTMMQTGYV